MRAQGFTLVELIAVLVILAITASVGSRFVVFAVEGARTVETSEVLVGRSRTSIEQMTRYLRSAVPNSIRVGAGGNCVEWMPSLGGGYYEGQLADSENMATLSSTIITVPFGLESESTTNYHAVVAAMSDDEIYSNVLPSSRSALSAPSASNIVSLSLSAPHRFIRNSLNQRVYVADDPKRICLASGQLLLYEGYGLDTSPLAATGNPGGDEILMANEVSSEGLPFTLSNGSENRNTTLDIQLRFSEGDFAITQNQTVFIRNVP
jgi:MSHA biogenesis protein MshO